MDMISLDIQRVLRDYSYRDRSLFQEGFDLTTEVYGWMVKYQIPSVSGNNWFSLPNPRQKVGRSAGLFESADDGIAYAKTCVSGRPVRVTAVFTELAVRNVVTMPYETLDTATVSFPERPRIPGHAFEQLPA